MIKHLTPRSEEEIRSRLSNNLSPKEKVQEGIKEHIYWLVEEALNEDPDVYIDRYDLLQMIRTSPDILKTLLSTDNFKCDDIIFRTICQSGNIEMINFLLDTGLDIHTDNDYALRSACVYGYVEIAKMLLNRGADLGISYYHTLHITKNEEIRNLLLKNIKKYDKAFDSTI